MKGILVIALTADGKIAKDSAHGANWTSKEDKQFFVHKTKEAGAVIMGLNTYNTINRPLPDRLNIVLTRTPEKEEQIPDSLEFTSQSPKDIFTGLESRGFKQVAVIGGAMINSLFFDANLIDELYLTVEPILFGAGLGLFANDIDLAKLKLLESKKLSDNVILLHYQVLK